MAVSTPAQYVPDIQIYQYYIYLYSCKGLQDGSQFSELSFLPYTTVNVTNLHIKFTVTLVKLKKRGKAIPVAGRGGPHGCETSRLPYFLNNRLTDGGEAANLRRRPPYTPRKIPGTQCGWKNYVN
jgi:hypothetical protein